MKKLVFIIMLCLVSSVCYGAGNDGSTVLLINCDGTDGSTTFTDTSQGGATHTVTANGTAEVDTAIKKFGTGALLLSDAQNSWLQVNHDAGNDFDFGTGDFTIDFWVYLTKDQEGYFLSSDGLSDDITIKYQAGVPDINVALMNNTFSFTWNPSAATWYHIAVERYNGNLRVYVGGTAIDSQDASTDDIDVSADLYFGFNSGDANKMDGNIDEIRISNIARYKGQNFSPSNEAYSGSSGQAIIIKGGI